MQANSDPKSHRELDANRSRRLIDRPMSTNLKRLILAVIFLLWMTFVVSAFYLVQKPDFVENWRGIIDTLLTLIVWGLLITNSMGLGSILLRNLPPVDYEPPERVLISTGVGMGLLGLIGFLLGVLGWTHEFILIGAQAALLLVLWWRKNLQSGIQDFRVFVQEWRNSMVSAPLWTKMALSLTLLFAFLLALAPPAEGFDALFYHLPVAERLLNGSVLQPSSVPHFWFPGLTEGVFMWAQGMGSIRATQLMHLTWVVLAILLVWYWALRVWDSKTAQASLIVIISLPSLYLLASWAYTDLALSFYGLVTIYAIYKANQENFGDPTSGWILVAGIASGMAMGVKYTSFLVPVTAVVLLFWWRRSHLGLALKSVLFFSAAAAVIAAPWYLRNWAVMGNPFYPFAFGGKSWDNYRAASFLGDGTGIGWNLKEISLLPLNATLGHKDANYYDGRVGPLYLILSPAMIYILFITKSYSLKKQRAIYSISFFTFLTFLAWTLGVINTSALWQTRLLFPVLISCSILGALGWQSLHKLDTPQFRISFIFKFIVIAVLAINLFNAGISVLARNPFAYAAGIESMESYLRKVQPSYAEAIELVEKSPADANVYSLFEPRSFYLPRPTQPDAILDNFAHDLYLYGDSEGVLDSWLAEGYTHVLIYRRGAEFVQGDDHKFSDEHQQALGYIIQNYFELVGETSDGSYGFYKILPVQ